MFIWNEDYPDQYELKQIDLDDKIGDIWDEKYEEKIIEKHHNRQKEQNEK